MDNNGKEGVSRRNFLKIAGLTGVGVGLAAVDRRQDTKINAIEDKLSEAPVTYHPESGLLQQRAESGLAHVEPISLQRFDLLQNLQGGEVQPVAIVYDAKEDKLILPRAGEFSVANSYEIGLVSNSDGTGNQLTLSTTNDDGNVIEHGTGKSFFSNDIPLDREGNLGGVYQQTLLDALRHLREHKPGDKRYAVYRMQAVLNPPPSEGESPTPPLSLPTSRIDGKPSILVQAVAFDQIGNRIRTWTDEVHGGSHRDDIEDILDPGYIPPYAYVNYQIRLSI